MTCASIGSGPADPGLVEATACCVNFSVVIADSNANAAF
jgi:hypothetical protein